jgi:hypothetical protein
MIVEWSGENQFFLVKIPELIDHVVMTCNSQ